MTSEGDKQRPGYIPAPWWENVVTYGRYLIWSFAEGDATDYHVDYPGILAQMPGIQNGPPEAPEYRPPHRVQPALLSDPGYIRYHRTRMELILIAGFAERYGTKYSLRTYSETLPRFLTKVASDVAKEIQAGRNTHSNENKLHSLGCVLRDYEQDPVAVLRLFN